MANPKVKLYYVCRTEEGWKRYPAAMGRNGKIRPQHAQVGNAQRLYEGGHYELRFWEDGRSQWKNVGPDASVALAQQVHLSKTMAAQVAAAEAGTQIVETDGRINLKLKAKEYQEKLTAEGKSRAHQTFTAAFNEFASTVKVQHADELTDKHIVRWYAALRRNGNADRTVYNKHVSVFGFLSWAKVNTKMLAKEAPDYTERTPKAYKRDDLSTFFGSLDDPYHKVVFETLLKTGLRMQEAMHMRWTDIDWDRKLLHVVARDEEGQTIKDRSERKVPLPDDLVRSLKAWRKVRAESKLVLGTSNDTPNWKWLPLLKRLVRDAGLNCGHCAGCKEQSRECRDWFLHRFRATYTTMMLRALNGDARTVMSYTGHEDLATVMRYLEPDETDRKRINAIKWGD